MKRPCFIGKTASPSRANLVSGFRLMRRNWPAGTQVGAFQIRWSRKGSSERESYRRIPEAAGLPGPSESIRWSRLWPTAALVVIGITATEVLWNSRGTTSAHSLTPARPGDDHRGSCSGTASSDETPLGLKVNSQPHQLEIRWNRDAPAVCRRCQRHDEHLGSRSHGSRSVRHLRSCGKDTSHTRLKPTTLASSSK